MYSNGIYQAGGGRVSLKIKEGMEVVIHSLSASNRNWADRFFFVETAYLGVELSSSLSEVWNATGLFRGFFLLFPVCCCLCCFFAYTSLAGVSVCLIESLFLWVVPSAKDIPARVESASVIERVLQLEVSSRTFDSSVHASSIDLSSEHTSGIALDGGEGSSSGLSTPKRQKGLFFVPLFSLLSKALLVWCLMVVFIVSSASKPKGSSVRADFLSH